MSNVTPQEVLTALKTHFDMGELEMLAFGLGIPFEDLGGNGRSGKALAMLQYSQRHGKYDDLVQAIANERDEVNWDVPKSSSTEGNSDKSQGTGGNTYIIQGDMVQGDKVGQDKVSGDKTAVDSISNSSGIGIGQDASAQVSNVAAAPVQPPPQQPTTQINIHGNVIGGVVGDGTVTANNIAGGDIVIGQEPKNKQEFEDQLAILEELLKEAIVNGEISPKDAQSVHDDVQDAVEEVTKEEPSPRRLTSRLEYVQEVLEKSTGVATAAGKVGSAVLKAAPIIAGLLKAASILF